MKNSYGEKFMIHEISELLSNKISSANGVIDNDKREIITFGLEGIIATLISASSALFIAFLFGRVLECIAFLAAFMPLRTYSGGFHASNHARCILLLIGTVMVEIFILYIVNKPCIGICGTSMMLSLILIAFFAPIEDINHPLSENQKRANKRRCIKVEITSICVAIFLIYFGFSNILLGYSYGILVTAISVAVATVANKINERRINSEKI